jgi:exodeoxyribonuclease-3
MTYNIKDGGRPGRLTAITRVIGQARPDILALQELRGFGRNGARLLHRLAGATGMRAVLARSVFGQPVAVLLREDAPILAKRQVYRPFHHAAARVTAGTDHGPLTVISTHLYPHWGRRRLWEARWLAHYADPRGLVLLMGDLNSLDPGPTIPAGCATCRRCTAGATCGGMAGWIPVRCPPSPMRASSTCAGR